MLTVGDTWNYHQIQSTSGEGYDIKVKEPEQPWLTLSRLVVMLKDKDAESWWNLSGSILGTLMKEANYDIQTQYACLIFHLYNVVPRLGPINRALQSNSGWRSFMCDDFSPLEYSWNWNANQKGPKIRYSVELVGASAGTPVDPYNRQATLGLCDSLWRDLPKADWTLFNIMQTAFYDSNSDHTSTTTRSSCSSSPSSLFLAFELGKHIATKAYFMPIKADQHGISRLTVLTRAIEMLRKSGYPCLAYDQLLQFMATEQGSTLEVILVAIDCFESAESRFKIYLRSPHTSFASVCNTLTLGSTLNSLPDIARANVKDLWRLTLGLAPNFSEADYLPTKRHQTSGVLYNFDIELHGSSIKPKLYIPVKHYANDDASAAEGLGLYLQSRGQDAYFPKYMRALQNTCKHRRLGERSGYQTYIGTGFQKDGSLALCSYVNGEVYHPKRVGF